MKTRGMIGGLLVGLLLWAMPLHAQVTQQGGIKDVVDTGNSTRTVLASQGGLNSTFTGVPFDTLGFAQTNVWILASELSMADGLRLQYSYDDNARNFRTLHSTTLLVSGQGFSLSVPPKARFFRLQYVNGLASLTSFIVSTIQRGGGAGTLVSTAPGSGASAPVTMTGLASIAGQVDLKAGAIVSFGAMQDPLRTEWRAPVEPYLISVNYTNGLASLTLVNGVAGQRIELYAVSFVLSSQASIGLREIVTASGTSRDIIGLSSFGASGGFVWNLPVPYTYRLPLLSSLMLYNPNGAAIGGWVLYSQR